MKLDKIKKELGAELIDSMNTLGSAELKEAIVSSEQAITGTKVELDLNPNYTKAKEDVKVLSQGFRDLKKFQNAKIQYALIRLEELGKL